MSPCKEVFSFTNTFMLSLFERLEFFLPVARATMALGSQVLVTAKGGGLVWAGIETQREEREAGGRSSTPYKGSFRRREVTSGTPPQGSESSPGRVQRFISQESSRNSNSNQFDSRNPVILHLLPCSEAKKRSRGSEVPG